MYPFKRSKLLDILFDIVGSLFYAIGLYTFAKAQNFAPGGLSGLALILHHLSHVPIGTTTLILNIPFILISYKIVGRQFLFKTARSMLLCTVFLDCIFPYTPSYQGSPLLAAMYSGVFLGAGLALFYMRGSSSGGTDFLTMSIKAKCPHLSIGAVTMAIDLLIIALGWPVFGSIDAALYGLIATFSTSTVINKIMYGIGSRKLLLIITSKGREVAAQIVSSSGRGATRIKAYGAYTCQEKEVLLCACSGAQTYPIKDMIYAIDPDAFIMLTETSEVFGEGFSSL